MMINLIIVSNGCKGRSMEERLVFKIRKINQPLDVEFSIRHRNLESGMRKIISIYRRGRSITSKVRILVIWLIINIYIFSITFL